MAEAGATALDAAPAVAESTNETTAAKKAAKAKRAPKAANTESGPRAGTKLALVVALLHRKHGATLGELMEKMGWLRHTCRGFVAGAIKKAGYAVESFKSDKGERTYRING